MKIINRNNIGLFLWNNYLRKVMVIYLKGTKLCNIINFEEKATYMREVLDELESLDLFIAEAFNPHRIDNAEGFRMAIRIAEFGFKAKPLIIFRKIDKEFHTIPYIIDYSTIYLLPDKIAALLRADSIDRTQLAPVIDRYPILMKAPLHH